MKKIIGYKHIDFTDKNNNQVNGYQVFFIEDGLNVDTGEVDNDLQGFRCEKCFMNEQAFNMMVSKLKDHGFEDVCNSEFTDYKYNRYGKISGILF